MKHLHPAEYLLAGAFAFFASSLLYVRWWIDREDRQHRKWIAAEPWE